MEIYGLEHFSVLFLEAGNKMKAVQLSRGYFIDT